MKLLLTVFFFASFVARSITQEQCSEEVIKRFHDCSKPTAEQKAEWEKKSAEAKDNFNRCFIDHECPLPEEPDVSTSDAAKPDHGSNNLPNLTDEQHTCIRNAIFVSAAAKINEKASKCLNYNVTWLAAVMQSKFNETEGSAELARPRGNQAKAKHGKGKSGKGGKSGFLDTLKNCKNAAEVKTCLKTLKEANKAEWEVKKAEFEAKSQEHCNRTAKCREELDDGCRKELDQLCSCAKAEQTISARRFRRFSKTNGKVPSLFSKDGFVQAGGHEPARTGEPASDLVGRLGFFQAGKSALQANKRGEFDNSKLEYFQGVLKSCGVELSLDETKLDHPRNFAKHQLTKRSAQHHESLIHHRLPFCQCDVPAAS